MTLTAENCLAALLGLILGLAGCARSEKPDERRDNVVVVVIDTLRRDHLATYGYGRQTAPFLDRLAREGAALEGVSPTSWTKPATASLLTGLHPLRHQAIGRLDALPAEAATLAERLQGEGYRTFGVSANGWVSEELGFAQGFDRLLLLDSEGSEAVNRRLFPLLDRLAPPYFLYVHYVDPHAPYAPRTAWDGGALPAALRDQGPVSVDSLEANTVKQRPRDFMDRVRDLYDGEIRGVDRELERLVGELERRGLMKDTVLVVTSDHGEEFEDHGRMSHGLSLYEEVVQVPLVIHAPHRIAAGLRGGLASLVDVVPTLLDLLGHPGGEGLDGASVAGDLRGRRGGSREGDGAERTLLFHLDHVDGVGLALTHGTDKLVLGKLPFRKEVYDLAADPAERHDLLGQGGGTRFEALARELADVHNGYTRDALPRHIAEVGESTRRELAALGYTAPGRSGEPRRLPRRIVPADRQPEGLVGWEGVDSLPGCVSLEGRDAERHLIRGWHEGEPGGRWSEPRGLLVLGAPAGAPAGAPSGARAALILQGVNHRPDSPRLRIAVNGQPALEALVPPGPFRWTAKTSVLPARRPVQIEIVTDPEFVPARSGAADQRSLGIFVTSICLVP
jgi:arylsulfatase A-like enzyme